MLSVAVACLLQKIQSIRAVTDCGNGNQLYLLIILPTAIANKTNVKSEFCGGDHDHDHENWVEWLKHSYPTERSVKKLQFI